ncbi:uncharacterized protein LOC106759558 [Vigna radiata var. radiata]|uniref:Uncharacterized protein LOC106759558 n=1 Tax=Vigna radiata var. radiata TaxID=3916 RepID=A0A1S3TWY4_VIGRR|nr:uncharacterized protein LOC106759558 [Vigna radiata var. radiata]
MAQKQYMDLILKSGNVVGSSFSSIIHQQDWSLESFLQHNPNKFSRKCSPDEVDEWLNNVERIYDAKRCVEDKRLTFTEYLLTGEARHWWSNMKMLLEDSNTHISWEDFKDKFYEEYYPDIVRFAKEVEFLQLIQGGMTVSEHTNKFKHFVRFYTMKVDEEWLCRKFENGLRGDLKLVIYSLCIKSLPALVEKAKVLETNMLEAKQQKKQQLKKDRETPSFRSSLSSRRTSYSRPSPSSNYGGVYSQHSGSVGHYEQQGSVGYYNYGGPHLKSACPQSTENKRCYRCRTKGHLEKDCLLGRRATTQNRSVL